MLSISRAYISRKFYVQLTFTTQEQVSKKGGEKTLLVSYHQFPSMCVQGDTIFLGKYLVTGSEDSSLFLTVRSLDGSCPLNHLCLVCDCFTLSHARKY